MRGSKRSFRTDADERGQDRNHRDGGLWAFLAILGLMTGLAAGCSSSTASTNESTNAPQTSTGSSATGAPSVGGPTTPGSAPSDDLHPVVLMRTSLGDIVLRLDAEKAPRTTYNFLSYAASGHYDQSIFHQVEKGYAALAGVYSSDLVERAGRYPLPSEAANGLKNRRGTIAMMRHPEDPNSATCQFFFNLGNNTSLDHQGDTPDKYGYCVFGEVVQGQDVLQKLEAAPVKDTEKFKMLPVETVLIHSVGRLR